MSVPPGAPLVPLYINGRFAAQNLTGVQRFASEMTAALQSLLGARLVVLVPPDAKPGIAGAVTAGRRTGQVWEQLDLPRAARAGLLINLGNTGPLTARRQCVVIHDAGVFSTPAAYSLKFRLWYKLLQRLLVLSRARIITVSAFSQGEIAAHLGCRAADIGVVREGADHMARIVADPGILAEHGLVSGGYVLAVGTLAAHKNLASLGELAERLAAAGKLLVITGALGSAVFAARPAGAPPAASLQARYIGRVTDGALKTLYEHAACYVVPSLYEGFCLPAVEAASCGCAVVAADIPALRETCGSAAVYFNPNAPAEIARAVLDLLADPQRLAAMREAARAHVAPMTWARAARSLAALIDAT
jgi:glycosyltransferase involved in cell wall biosynthesis